MSTPSPPQNSVTYEEALEFRERSKRSPWLAYPLSCVPAILPWHQSTSDYRVLAGPNNGGKTTAGAFEMVAYATGYNPIRKEHYDTPNICWAVCVEYKSAGYVMFRKLAEMLPRKENGARNWVYNKQDHVIKLPSPWFSEIHIKSQKEGESSLLADRCTAIWIDEAMGGDTGNENFGELQARGLPDTPLKMYFTLTPKMDTGIEWMHRKLWKDPKRPEMMPHEDFIEGTYCHEFELSDCLKEKGGYISREVYERRLAETDPEEAAARIYAKWTPFHTKPAFSWKFLMSARERCPVQKHVRFKKSSLYRPIVEESVESPGRMQRERESGHNYIAAWDPSSGLGKGHDYSALVVFDRADLSLVFHARTREMGPDEFARDIALPASLYYNDARLIVESNGEGGGAAIATVKDSNANLYYATMLTKAGAGLTDRIGWVTTEQSRFRMIDALQRALKEDRWTPSIDLLEEMEHVMKKPMPSGRYRIEHADGFHDDLVMAAGIALAVHYEEPVEEFPDFGSLRIRYTPNRSLQEMPFT